MPKVTFLPSGASGEVAAGITLLAAALEMGLRVGHLCGGTGICFTCLVEVLDGPDCLTPPEKIELNGLRWLRAPRGYRLACQARVIKDTVARFHASDSEPL